MLVTISAYCYAVCTQFIFLQQKMDRLQNQTHNALTQKKNVEQDIRHCERLWLRKQTRENVVLVIRVLLGLMSLSI